MGSCVDMELMLEYGHECKLLNGIFKGKRFNYFD